MEKTWLRDVIKCLGTKDQLLLKQLISYLALPGLQTSLWEFLYKTVIKSLELELSQLEELRLEFLNQEWCASSPLVDTSLKSSLLSNIIANSSVLTLVTMLDSTSKIFLLLKLVEDLLDLMPRMILLVLLNLSQLRLSLWIIQIRLPMVILQLLTLELLMLPANLHVSNNLSTKEMERLYRKSLLALKRETLPWLRLFPLNR